MKTKTVRFSLSASLALWRRRVAFRTARLAAARKSGSTARVNHWEHLLHEARSNVAERSRQVAAARPLRLKALDEAYGLLRVNLREDHGNNRGAWPDRIIRYALGSLGESYCVDAVIWAYGHAGSKVVRPGFTRAVRYMKTSGLVAVPLRLALAGHIVRYTFDHTGILVGYCDANGKRVSRLRATHVLVLEGNTSQEGAQNVSDGTSPTDGYYLKLRSLDVVRDFLAVTR